jgi:hypothetical protein
MHFDDASVSTLAVFENRGNFIKQHTHDILLASLDHFCLGRKHSLGIMPQARCHEPSGVNGAALTERHHLFRYWSSSFGFSQSGGHAFVGDQAANQIGQHGIPMLSRTAEFRSSFLMSHVRRP